MVKLRLLTNETFRSLRVRNFRLFFGGQLISQVGNWLTLVTQTLLVLKLTGSGVALGVLAAFQFGPVLLVGPWAGLVADRSDKRKLLLVVQAIAMCQSLALAALAFTGNPPVWSIYFVALIGGFTVAFDNPARRAFVVEMVPTDNVNNAVSLNSALMTSSRVVGPALAGLLVTTVGFGWAFLGDAISYLAVLAALYAMRTEELHPAPVTPKAKGQVREGFRYARSVPELWVPLTMMAVVGTLAFNFQVVFPLFVTRDLGGTDASFTILFSVVSLGALAGALISARRTRIDVRIVGLTAVAFGVALGLISLAPSLGVAFPLGLLVGLGSISFLTSSTAIVQVCADPTMRGRVLALQAMVFLGSTPIGGPIVGYIAEHAGSRWAIGVGAVAAVGAGLWGISVAKRSIPERLSEDERVEAVADGVLDAERSGPVPVVRDGRGGPSPTAAPAR
jgi:MFS family permease